jgi:SH3 domain-containing YSC84-like protein 1
VDRSDFQTKEPDMIQPTMPRDAVTRRTFLLAGAQAAALVAAVPGLARADDLGDAKGLVDKARLTVDAFRSDKMMSALRDLAEKGRGLFICPALLKGAFIFGAAGGSGVFVAHDKNSWSQPAFYTMGEASFGFQAGGQSSEVILVAMTERGVSAMLSTSFKLGADASVAAGPVGVGAKAATENLSADILSFIRSKGLYGGVSVDGAVVAVRGSLNNAYYDKEVSPTDIIVKREVSNPYSARLLESVTKLSAVSGKGKRARWSGTAPA